MSASASVVVRLIVPVVVTLVAMIVPFAVMLTLALLLPTTAFSSNPSVPTSLMTMFWFFCCTPAERMSTSVSIAIRPAVEFRLAVLATMSATPASTTSSRMLP